MYEHHVYLYLSKAIANKNPGDTNRLYKIKLKCAFNNISPRTQFPFATIIEILLIGSVSDISRSDAASAMINLSHGVIYKNIHKNRFKKLLIIAVTVTVYKN